MAGREDNTAALVGETLTRREREILALLAEGLTGPEIAARLTVATSSVKSHLQHLYSKLGVNSRRQAVSRAQALGLLTPQAEAVPAASATPTSPKHNLPQQLTRFFGREDDIARVQERLAEWRLVTLTGPGGVGKTRLALRVAEEALAYFPDGVWFVALAPLSDPAAVPRHVARILGVRERADWSTFASLATDLGEQRVLLVLDNCEHMLEICAQLSDHLLRSCLRLRILATSREAIGISGEANYVVPSLPFPDPQHLPALDELARFTAVSLFVDRARALVPEYAVTPKNAEFLARICQRLDGIPLALELAAARTNLLTAEQLAVRLDNVFALPTGGSRTALPRHQTLRATIDWSYNLLSEGEQLLLQRLAVFAGGCTLEAAEAVCAGEGLSEGQVLEHLAGLVQKSMVVAGRGPGDEPRYRLLEMVRQYGGEMLVAAGEQERLCRRHWQYFLRLAESKSRSLLSTEWRAGFDRFQADLENLRLALAWAFKQALDPEAGIQLLVALQPVWFVWDRRETRKWAASGLEQLRRGEPIAPALQARFLAWASAAHWCQRNVENAGALAERSLAIARTLDPAEAETLCWSLWIQAIGLDACYMEILPEHWDQAEALLDEQEALFPALGPGAILDPRLYRSYNRWLRAVLANYRGQYDRAEAYGLESLRLVQDDFHGMHLIGPYLALGDTALRSGAYEKAVAYFEEAHKRVVLSSDLSYVDVRSNDVLNLLCEAHRRRGDLAQALHYCRLSIRDTTALYCLERIEAAARICALAGRYPEAARLSAAAEGESERHGRKTSSRTVAQAYWGDWRTRYADLTLQALVPDWPNRPDAGAIQQAWNEGRIMTEQQARAYALALEL